MSWLASPQSDQGRRVTKQAPLWTMSRVKWNEFIQEICKECLLLEAGGLDMVGLCWTVSPKQYCKTVWVQTFSRHVYLKVFVWHELHTFFHTTKVKARIMEALKCMRWFRSAEGGSTAQGAGPGRWTAVLQGHSCALEKRFEFKTFKRRCV